MHKPLTRSRRIVPVIALAAASTLAVAPAALGQATGSSRKEPLTPPTAPLSSDSSAPWKPMIAAVVIGAIVLGVAFIPSKRGHQD